MTISAALFDIDGTLVDSDYLHVDAWSRAFDELGETVDSWRIHRAIGQDSSRLLAALAGDHDDEWMRRAKDLHSRHYRELAGRLRPFAQAADLLRDLAGRGIRVVLATSAPADELELLLRCLDAGDAIHATTNADDVQTAKPEPGIIEVALERAQSAPSDALFIGDSVWDMMAAARAHVRAVAVLSGGVGPAELLEAGAVEVFDDPADLRARMGRLIGV